MKLLLVLGSDDNYGVISENAKALGFAIIRYRYVLKAMDNIDEIDPEAVIISAGDFPLHWKLLVQFIRSDRPKEICPIIILKGDRFDTEETSEALFLGVNGVMAESLDTNEDLDRFKQILGCNYDEKKPCSCAVEPWHHVGLLLSGLCGKPIISGDVKAISSDSLTFTPPDSWSIDASLLHQELHECSLRVGDSIFSPVCRINGIDHNILLDFVSFPGDEQQALTRQLEML